MQENNSTHNEDINSEAKYQEQLFYYVRKEGLQHDTQCYFSPCSLFVLICKLLDNSLVESCETSGKNIQTISVEVFIADEVFRYIVIEDVSVFKFEL